MSVKILVIHGPNLNRLGRREQEHYGNITLEEINRALRKEAKALKVGLTVRQSNHEGVLLDWIGKAARGVRGILINPAAYTHTSVALRDALLAAGVPAVEVHLSNIARREPFRQVSLTAAACVGQVSGFGLKSYTLGLRGLVAALKGD